MQPPPRLLPRRFTPAFAASVDRRSSRWITTDQLLLIHFACPKQQRFELVGCDDQWNPMQSSGYCSLSQAIQLAEAEFGIAADRWKWFEPQSESKLYLDNDEPWVRIRHRKVRKEFIEMQTQVPQRRK